ncbi:MAG: translation elongation factor Ts [Planctomycetes bacterium]|nr:translation elongation factor Ts [Planctomycetota bacterium]MBL7009252.1 translation elongation factor Ts [Planctomycetota bacterium]
MTTISAQAVATLRAKSGAGMMDCKKALVETGGDEVKAMELLRAKGLKTADKKADRVTGDGRVHAYIHHNQKVGVLVEVACETDFVARGEVFTQLLNDLCMHIAAIRPTPVAVLESDVSEELVSEEKRQLLLAEDLQGKPDEIKEKIVGGRIRKFITERALYSQEFVKDPSVTVEDMVKKVIANLGENIKVNRFSRFELGS